jgi:glucose-1-phosphate cytidylyltransferase
MKVVLFCGGLGTRLKEYSETIPKPMVPVGFRPVIWNVMRYYAHYGHRDFILCLGYKADTIKEYFLNYNECLSNDFTLSNGGRNIKLFKKDISDWNISFVDTGQLSNIGERLMAVRHLVEDDEVFLANYSDGLTDMDLNHQLNQFYRRDAIASMVLVRPPHQSFHFARVSNEEAIVQMTSIEQTDLWVNGGYFALRREIFDYMEQGEELVEKPFSRVIKAGKLHGYQYRGFWTCMDTFKDKKLLDDMYNRGDRPWEVWRRQPGVAD